jgi:hypothetical protein
MCGKIAAMWRMNVIILPDDGHKGAKYFIK